MITLKVLMVQLGHLQSNWRQVHCYWNSSQGHLSHDGDRWWQVYWDIHRQGQHFCPYFWQINSLRTEIFCCFWNIKFYFKKESCFSFPWSWNNLDFWSISSLSTFLRTRSIRGSRVISLYSLLIWDQKFSWKVARNYRFLNSAFVYLHT